MNKGWRIDPNHGEIRFGIITDQVPPIIATIGKINGNSRGVVNDMAVRQNESIRRNYESRAASARLTQVIFALLLNLDVSDRGRDPIDCGHHRARILIQ
jgi:hypothetical protein